MMVMIPTRPQPALAHSCQQSGAALSVLCVLPAGQSGETDVTGARGHRSGFGPGEGASAAEAPVGGFARMSLLERVPGAVVAVLLVAALVGLIKFDIERTASSSAIIQGNPAK